MSQCRWFESTRQALDRAVDQPAAWQIWADALLEQGDPLGQWLTTPRTKHELEASLGRSLFHSDRHFEMWNQFGFLDEWSVAADLFLSHPHCFDPAQTPAVRYARSLSIRAEPEQIEPCLVALQTAPLPRSLRTLGVHSGAPVRFRIDTLINDTLAMIRQRCPSFETQSLRFD